MPVVADFRLQVSGFRIQGSDLHAHPRAIIIKRPRIAAKLLLQRGIRFSESPTSLPMYSAIMHSGYKAIASRFLTGDERIGTLGQLLR